MPSQPLSRRPLRMDTLESRINPVVTSNVAAGVLAITSDADSDSIAITTVGGNVQVNGNDPDSGAAAANTITEIAIAGGDGDDTIDLTGVSLTDFTTLTSIQADGEADADRFQLAGDLTGTQLTTLALSGGIGADVFDVDISAGVPIPDAGLAIDGGDDIDQALLGGGNVTSVRYDVGNALIDIDGFSVTFPNLEQAFDNLGATNRTFTFTDNDENIVTDPDQPAASDGITRASLAGTDVFVEFVTPTGDLLVELGDGDDTFTYNGLDTDLIPSSITVDGGDGTDRLLLENTGLGSTFDSVDYNFTTGAITLGAGIINVAVNVPGLEEFIDNFTATDRTFTTTNGSENVVTDPGADNGRVSVTLDGTPILIDFATPEGNLTVNLAEGDDTFTYNGLDTDLTPDNIIVNAGMGVDRLILNNTALGSIFDTVDYNFTTGAITLGADTISVSVSVPGFEEFIDNFSSTDRSFTTTDGAENVLTDIGDVDGRVTVTLEGTPILIEFGTPEGDLVVNLGAGDDSFTYNGLDTDLTPTNITVDGGDGTDRLILNDTVLGSSFDSVNYDFTAGALTLGADTIGVSVNIPGLEEFIDNFTATNRSFTTTDGAENVVTAIGDDDGRVTVSLVGTPILIEFATPEGDLVVNLGAGDDTFTYNGLDTDLTPASITVDGGDGTDRLILNNTALGNILDSVDYNFTTGAITLGADTISVAVNVPGLEEFIDNFTASDRSFTTTDGGENVVTAIGDVDGRVSVTLASTPILIDFTTPEGDLTVNLGAGDDTFTYNGLNTDLTPMSITVDGGDGIDRLLLENTALGNTVDAVDYNFINGTLSIDIESQVVEVNVPSLEEFVDNFTATDRRFTTTNGAENVVTAVGALDGRVQVLLDGTPILIEFSTPVGDLLVDLGAGDDTFTYNGLDTDLTPTNITVDGNEGLDRIVLNSTGVGSEFDAIAYDFAAAIVSLTLGAASVPVNVPGLEEVVDNLTATMRAFSYSDAAEVVTLSGGPSSDALLQLQVEGLPGFVDFTAPIDMLAIDTLGGADRLLFSGLDTDGGIPATINLNAGDGDDNVTISGGPERLLDGGAASQINVNGAAGNDLLDVLPQEFAGVNYDGADGNDTLTLTLNGALGQTIGDGSITFTNRQPITFTNVESIPTTPVDATADQNEVSFYAINGGLEVALFDGVNFVSNLTPFSEIEASGGTRSAVADVNGDGTPELITATGPGPRGLVRVTDPTSGDVLLELMPFEASFAGGLFVAAGDYNNDGAADIVVTPDQGGGARVSIFDGQTGAELANFFGIEDPNFRGGARAGVGDLNADGFTDLIVAAGFGGGPRIALFNGQTILEGEGMLPPKLIPDFFIFESTVRDGTFVSAGDFNGDGSAELVASGGPGSGPRVFGVDGATLLSGGGLSPVFNFFAGNSAERNGIRIAVKDFNQDGQSDLVTADQQLVRAFDGTSLIDNSDPADLAEFMPFEDADGLFVG